MEEQIQKLKREVEELERQIAARPFSGLLDRKRADQLYHRLKKKRKELARAEGNERPVPTTANAVSQPKKEKTARTRTTGSKAKSTTTVKSAKPAATPKTPSPKKAGKSTAKTKTATGEKTKAGGGTRSKAKKESSGQRTARKAARPPVKAKETTAKTQPSRRSPGAKKTTRTPRKKKETG